MGRHGLFRDRGLTLVELLFAISVLAIVSLGVAGMFPSALRSVVSGGQVTKAAALAQEMADMIRTEQFDSLYSTPSAGNGYLGYSAFDSRNLPSTCSSASAASCSNKKKWQADILAGTAQSSGQGLPGGYGTAAVTCMSTIASSPYTLTPTTCSTSTNILRISVTVFWGGGTPRSVNLVTYVARVE